MITELTQDPKLALKGVPAAVVVFYAAWCTDCKVSEEYEEKVAERFAGIGFYRFDAIEQEAIADAYQIERYPTYVFFRKGKPQRGVLVEPVAEGEVLNWLEIKLGRRR